MSTARSSWSGSVGAACAASRTVTASSRRHAPVVSHWTLLIGSRLALALCVPAAHVDVVVVVGEGRCCWRRRRRRKRKGRMTCRTWWPGWMCCRCCRKSETFDDDDDDDFSSVCRALFFSRPPPPSPLVYPSLFLFPSPQSPHPNTLHHPLPHLLKSHVHPVA